MSSYGATAETVYRCRLHPTGSGGAAGAVYAVLPRRAALPNPGWGTSTPASRKPPLRSWSIGSSHNDPGTGAAAAATLYCCPPPNPPGPGCTPGLLETVKPSPSFPPPPWRPGQDGSGGSGKDPPSTPRQQTSRAHRRPRRVGRAAAAGTGIRGRRAGSAVPSPAGGAAAAGARARRGGGGGSVGLDSARAQARTPPSLPWPRAAPPPPPPAAANQSRSLARLPGAAPEGGAARGAQSARSRREVIGYRSVTLSIRQSAERWGTAVQSLPCGPGRGWAAPGPIPGQGSARLPVSWFGSRLPLPPGPAELPRRSPRRSLGGSFRNASGRSAAARGPGVRPSAAPGKRVRRGGPRAGVRRGEGEGKGQGKEGAVSGWASSRLHRYITPALPSPPLPQRHRPRLGALTPAEVVWRDHSPSGWSAAPPGTRFGWVSSLTQTLPGFFPITIARACRLSLHPACPKALSAVPRPQLLTPVWAKSCTALCTRPRP